MRMTLWAGSCWQVAAIRWLRASFTHAKQDTAAVTPHRIRTDLLPNTGPHAPATRRESRLELACFPALSGTPLVAPGATALHAVAAAPQHGTCHLPRGKLSGCALPMTTAMRANFRNVLHPGAAVPFTPAAKPHNSLVPWHLTQPMLNSDAVAVNAHRPGPGLRFPHALPQTRTSDAVQTRTYNKDESSRWVSWVSGSGIHV